jgi:hypothetical protein
LHGRILSQVGLAPSTSAIAAGFRGGYSGKSCVAYYRRNASVIRPAWALRTIHVVNPQRRRLFFLPVLAGAVALVAKPAAALPATNQPTSNSGYQLTPHVERFYRSAGRL